MPTHKRLTDRQIAARDAAQLHADPQGTQATPTGITRRAAARDAAQLHADPQGTHATPTGISRRAAARDTAQLHADPQGTQATPTGISRRAAANRANAQKSTGPRTATGKARSRYNALKHGILARDVVPIPLELYESPADYADFHDALREELQPATLLEEALVESIAAGYWRLRRILRVEGARIAARQATVQTDLEAEEALEDLRPRPPSGPQITPAPLPGTPQERGHRLAIMQGTRSLPDLDTAMLLLRYESHLERQIHRALAALERLQARRTGQEPPSSPAPAAGPAPGPRP